MWYIKLIIHIRAAIAAIPQLVDVRVAAAAALSVPLLIDIFILVLAPTLRAAAAALTIRAAIAAIPQLVDVDLRGSIIDPYMIFDEGQHLYVKVGVKRVAAAAATTTDVVITTYVYLGYYSSSCCYKSSGSCSTPTRSPQPTSLRLA